jgi:hypothetical protein
MKLSLPLTGLLTASMLLGAGCERPSFPLSIPPAQPPQPAAPAAERGFGLLPAIAAPGTLGSPEAMSSRLSSAIPPIAPVASTNAVGGGGVAGSVPAKDAAVGMDAMMIRPEPYPMKTVPVRYNVTAALPTWDAEDHVLRAKPAQLPTSGITAVVTGSGLPSQVIGSNPDVRSVNFSWKDADGLTWNFDGYGRSLGFWKDGDVRIMAESVTNQKIAPTMEDAEAIRIADDFLTRKGLSFIARGSATVEKPWGYGIEPASMPCPTEPMPYVKTEEAAAAGTSGSATSDSKMMIAPCGGWYPPQLTVSYTAQIGSRDVHDAGGWPFRAVSLQIDLVTKQIVGGNVWLPPQTESSRYPLISSAEAAKRLQEGGRNPIYPYYGGDDVKEIVVTIEKTSLVWMRYDSWTNNQTQTYFVPAIAAEGTVSYAPDRKDLYRTVVPLVADDAFGGNDQPKIMPMDAAVSEPAVAPAVMPTPVNR